MNELFTTRFGVGARAPRFEDQRFITGAGRFGDDVNLPGQLYAELVTSPLPSARIKAIDPAAAIDMPGVVAVFTAEDLEADGVGHIPCPLLRRLTLKRSDGERLEAPPRPALAAGRARFVGEAVAMVVARTAQEARDAAEAVELDLEELPAAARLEDAAASGAPPVWDHHPDNTVFLHEVGDVGATDEAIARAHHTVTVTLPFQRLAMNPMEPRTALGAFEDGRATLYCGVQNPHVTRGEIALLLGLETEAVRVVANDMGGAFGMRSAVFPEMILTVWAARRLGHPVKWTGTRSAHFLADDAGRDMVMTATLGLSADGTFEALRVTSTAAMGAFLSRAGPVPAIGNLPGLAGFYRTPLIAATVRGVFTNAAPIAPYRGAGRPEAICCIELAIDKAARTLGMDRLALRRQNMIEPQALPFQTALSFRYDCGDFPAIMARAAELADVEGFDARRADAQARGKRLGLGIANAVEGTAAFMDEGAQIEFSAAGAATLRMGSANHGQGHETVLRQVVAERLFLPIEEIAYVMGDTDKVAHGTGTFGSRSAIYAGSAAVNACEAVIGRATEVAAEAFGVAPEAVRFDTGRFYAEGTNETFGWVDLAARAAEAGAPLSVKATFASEDAATYPNATHICEIEIDPATGAAAVTRYTAVVDVGTLLNPMIVEGQVHGGVVQGLGQVLCEQMVYDETGQPVTGSFMDYAMPRADDLCRIAVDHRPVPTSKNPLGVKGAGEAGTVGGLASGLSAVSDALASAGTETVLMPATPQALWQALNRGR